MRGIHVCAVTGMVLVGLVVSPPAHAQDNSNLAPADPSTLVPTRPSPPAPEPPPASPTYWYGWQTLASDLVATSMIVGGVASSKGAVTWTGVGLFALGAPVLHAIRGHDDKVGIDLLIRTLGPVATGFVGALIGSASTPCPPAPSHCDFQQSGGVVVGGALGIGAGMIGASVFDAAYLARDRPSPSDGTQQSHFQWAPTLAFSREGGTLGIGGTF